jgi:hypothetical protein
MRQPRSLLSLRRTFCWCANRPLLQWLLRVNVRSARTRGVSNEAEARTATTGARWLDCSASPPHLSLGGLANKRSGRPKEPRSAGAPLPELRSHRGLAASLRGDLPIQVAILSEGLAAKSLLPVMLVSGRERHVQKSAQSTHAARASR